jgi:hypothetical protein
MKNKKIDWDNVTRDVQVVASFILILVGVLSIIQGVQLFYIGFHNMDLAYNGCIMSNDLGLQYRGLMDEYTFGKTMSLTDFYHIALEQMQSGMKLGMFGAFALGMGLAQFLFIEGVKRK